MKNWLFCRVLLCFASSSIRYSLLHFYCCLCVCVVFVGRDRKKTCSQQLFYMCKGGKESNRRETAEATMREQKDMLACLRILITPQSEWMNEWTTVSKYNVHWKCSKSVASINNNGSAISPHEWIISKVQVWPVRPIFVVVVRVRCTKWEADGWKMILGSSLSKSRRMTGSICIHTCSDLLRTDSDMYAWRSRRSPAFVESCRQKISFFPHRIWRKKETLQKASFLPAMKILRKLMLTFFLLSTEFYFLELTRGYFSSQTVSIPLTGASFGRRIRLQLPSTAGKTGGRFFSS